MDPKVDIGPVACMYGRVAARSCRSGQCTCLGEAERCWSRLVGCRGWSRLKSSMSKDGREGVGANNETGDDGKGAAQGICDGVVSGIAVYSQSKNNERPSVL
jgi:hypothetical protein